MSNGNGDGWLKSLRQHFYLTSGEKRQNLQNIEGWRQYRLAETAKGQAQAWQELARTPYTKQWMEVQKFIGEREKNLPLGGVKDQLNRFFPGGAAKGTAEYSQSIQQGGFIGMGGNVPMWQDEDVDNLEFGMRQSVMGAARDFEKVGYETLAKGLKDNEASGTKIMGILSQEMRKKPEADMLSTLMDMEEEIGKMGITDPQYAYWTTGFGSHFMGHAQASASGGFTNPSMYARNALEGMKQAEDFNTGAAREKTAQAEVGFYRQAETFGESFATEEKAQAFVETMSGKEAGKVSGEWGYQVMETTDGKWAALRLPLDGPALTIPHKFDPEAFKAAKGIEDMSAYYDVTDAKTPLHIGMSKAPRDARDQFTEDAIQELTGRKLWEQGQFLPPGGGAGQADGGLEALFTPYPEGLTASFSEGQPDAYSINGRKLSDEEEMALMEQRHELRTLVMESGEWPSHYGYQDRHRYSDDLVRRYLEGEKDMGTHFDDVRTPEDFVKKFMKRGGAKQEADYQNQPAPTGYDPMALGEGGGKTGEESLTEAYQQVQEIGKLVQSDPSAITQQHMEFLQGVRDTFARQVDPILQAIQEAQSAEAGRQGASEIIRQLRMGQTGYGIGG